MREEKLSAGWLQLERKRRTFIGICVIQAGRFAEKAIVSAN